MKKNIVKIAIFKNKFWLLLIVLFYATFEIVGTTLVMQLGEVFDIVTISDISKHGDLMREYILDFIILLTALIVLFMIYSCFQACYLQRVYSYTRENFFEKTLNKCIASFNKKDKAYYQSILINDMKQLENNYYLPMLIIIKQIVSVVISLFFLAHYSVYILLFVLFASLLPYIIPKLFVNKLKKRIKRYEEVMEKYTLISNELLSGYEVFKNYNAESRVLAMHRETSECYAKIKLRANSFIEYMQNSAIFSGNLVMFGVLILGLILSIYGNFSVGNIFAIYYISAAVTSPLNELIENLPKLTAGKVFVRKYDNHNIKEKEKGPVSSIINEICMKDFSVTLGDQVVPTLKNINLNFRHGKKYLLVGESGGGKSTILKSILGYYDTYDGEITYDKIHLSSYLNMGIFEKIVYLPQQPNFYLGTIRENLSVFDENISDEDIEYAVKFVELHEKIMELGNGTFKNGLNAVISESATNISGGQKQCLALARGLIKNVNFFILDEATSAIDIKTSIKIEKKLLRSPECTVIFVAHRLHDEVLNLYDEIIVVDAGKIIEKGNFKELLGIKGKFFDIYNAKGFV